MTKQILLQILRSYVRNKLPFIIKLSGFVIGLTAVILAVVIIVDESKFDQFHRDNPYIYRASLLHE